VLRAGAVTPQLRSAGVMIFRPQTAECIFKAVDFPHNRFCLSFVKHFPVLFNKSDNGIVIVCKKINSKWNV
jgi:hypothetical protein